MSIQLFRIDDRLIHGQVIMGWGRKHRFRRYLVVDDELAESPWEQELYALTVDDDAEVVFSTVAEASAALSGWVVDSVPSILLTRDPGHMARLGAGGVLAGRTINVGGLHHRPGRVEVRSYIHLDEEDREALRLLEREGAEVEGRDLPDSPRIPLDQLLA